MRGCRFGVVVAVNLSILVCLTLSGCGGGGNESLQKSSAISDQTKQDPRIVNGTPLDQSSAPFIKLLATQIPEGFAVCTGTFINPTQILTAAHCVVHNGQIAAPSNINLQINPGQFITASSVVVHPEYSGTFVPSADFANLAYMVGDLAIVTSSQPYTGPIPVLWTGIPAVGQSVVIAGYGQTSDYDQASPTLNVGTTVIDGISGADRSIYWVFNGGAESSTCHGDSGGPLLVSLTTGEVALIGVNSSIAGVATSSGSPSCGPGSSANDVLVALYLDWISQATGGNFVIR